MFENFNFSEWFDSLSRSEKINSDYVNAVIDLSTSEKDMSSFTVSNNMVINNVGFIEKNSNDEYFVDIPISRIGDIITEFKIECDSKYSLEKVKMSLILGGCSMPLTSNIKYAIACTPFTKSDIRLTFTDIPFDVKLSYNNYILQLNLRDSLLRKETFSHDGINYSGGVAIPQ